MKEVMAIIRIDMINKTKQALLLEGFPAMNCRKAFGRGKQKVSFSMVEDLISASDTEVPSNIAEAISEGHRLIPKRVISMVVNDDEVKKVVDCIISTNSKGKPGDGKIFVMPVNDAIRVRTGESGQSAL